MKFRIREFQPVEEEYLACLNLWQACFPDQPPPETLEEARHSDRTRPAGLFKVKFVATLDQTIVGGGEVTTPAGIAVPGRMSFAYLIHPDHEKLIVDGQSVHARIERYVLDLVADQGITGLLTRAREDKRVMVEWLEAHGYACRMRMPLSTLDVPAFDFGPWAGYVERVEASGIAFHTLAYLKTHDPDWHAKLFRAWAEIFLDVPSPLPARPKTQAEFNRMLAKPAVSPDLWLIAVDDAPRDDGAQWGPYAGVTLVNRVASAPTVWDVALTGVCRHWRRRGIATALKLKSIAMAKDRKAAMFQTGNEEANPMLRINMRLGFALVPAWLDYEKVLEAA